MEIITTIFASLVLALVSVAGLVGYLVYQNSKVLASNKQGKTIKVASNDSVEIVQNSWCRKALNEASTHCCHLFDYIVKSQGTEEWGSVLDAGTGSHSLDWLLDLPAESITAVTGDPKRQASMERMFSGRLRSTDTVVAGNWKDPKFLQFKVYDVVLADYLLGSIDAFAPYFQDRLFERLKPHVGKKLYIVGAEPFPDKDDTAHGQLIIDIAKTRDACILLAGDRPYREYPLDWVIRNLKQNGYKVESFGYFETTYSQEYVETQINVAEAKLSRFSNESVADAMQSQIDKLRSKVLRMRWGMKWGSDYVVVASPIRGAHHHEMVKEVSIKSPVQEQPHIFPIDDE